MNNRTNKIRQLQREYQQNQVRMQATRTPAGRELLEQQQIAVASQLRQLGADVPD